MAGGWLIKEGAKLTVLGAHGGELPEALNPHPAGLRNRARAAERADGMYRISWPERGRLRFRIGRLVLLTAEIARLQKRVDAGRPRTFRHGAPGIAGNQAVEARVNGMNEGRFKAAREQLGNLIAFRDR